MAVGGLALGLPFAFTPPGGILLPVLGSSTASSSLVLWDALILLLLRDKEDEEDEEDEEVVCFGFRRLAVSLGAAPEVEAAEALP